jgi:SAM-dependent methyltransferase
MRSLAALLLVACAHAPPPAKPPACPPVPIAVAPVASTALAPPEVEALATRFLAALGDRDRDAFAAQSTESFVWFVFGRTYDRKNMLARYATASSAPRPARTCGHVRVRVGAGSAIYTAECTDKYAAHEDMPAYESVGLYSIVFVPDAAVWKASYASFQPATVAMERELWNDTFQRGAGFRKEANQHLIDSVKGRKPGKALDIAMGQGRNVLGLAALGWKVTGVDISDAGIKLAKDAAAKQKLTFESVVEDIDRYDLGTAKWDLVSLIYAGGDPKLIERIKTSVKKGGIVVVEFFHKDATAGVGIGGFATGELAAQFAGWKIVKDEVVEDIADWGLRKTKLVRFAAQKN